MESLFSSSVEARTLLDFVLLYFVACINLRSKPRTILNCKSPLFSPVAISWTAKGCIVFCRSIPKLSSNPATLTGFLVHRIMVQLNTVCLCTLPEYLIRCKPKSFGKITALSGTYLSKTHFRCWTFHRTNRIFQSSPRSSINYTTVAHRLRHITVPCTTLLSAWSITVIVISCLSL
jgi:hypothetical protein